jgi:hypothetical protein
VGGSLATGDWRAGVSDLDLVAVAEGRVDDGRRRELAGLHRSLDAEEARGLTLGCVYVDASALSETDRRHPTWTHGRLVDRVLSGVARAELVRHGHALAGRPPAEVLPPVSPDELRSAVRAELAGYWTWAVRRPWLWLSPALADLGLVTMARARHALATGELMTKTAALDLVRAPGWMVEQLRRRRGGEPARSPRLRAGAVAWRDARRTVRAGASLSSAGARRRA